MTKRTVAKSAARPSLSWMIGDFILAASLAAGLAATGFAMMIEGSLR